HHRQGVATGHAPGRRRDRSRPGAPGDPGAAAPGRHRPDQHADASAPGEPPAAAPGDTAAARQAARADAAALPVVHHPHTPAVRRNAEAAQSAYVTASIPFLCLVEAQRNVVSLQDRFYEALAGAFRRRATLERVVGGALVPGGTPPSTPRPQ